MSKFHKKLKILLFIIPLLTFLGYSEGSIEKDSIDLKFLAERMFKEYYGAFLKTDKERIKILKNYMTPMMINELFFREKDSDPLLNIQDIGGIDLKNMRVFDTPNPDWVKVLILNYNGYTEKDKDLDNIDFYEINLHFIYVDNNPFINAVDTILHMNNSPEFKKFSVITRYANKDFLSLEDKKKIEKAKKIQEKDSQMGYIPLGGYFIIDDMDKHKD